MKSPARNKPAIMGRYETRDVARLARNRFEDMPGAYHRVRFDPCERYPEYPWTLVVYEWKEEADLIDHNGEVLQ